MIIAIDGPSGAGKTSTARLVAHRLGAKTIDTGLLYRILADAAEDDTRIQEICADTTTPDTLAATYESITGDPKTYADMKDNARSHGASIISANPAVRKVVVATTRLIASNGDYVIEGRNIATETFPDADIKIYLDCEVTTRAARRISQMADAGKLDETSYHEQLLSLIRRDARDQNRKASPATIADDAIRIDTGYLHLDAVAKLVYDMASEKTKQSQPKE